MSAAPDPFAPDDWVDGFPATTPAPTRPRRKRSASHVTPDPWTGYMPPESKPEPTGPCVKETRVDMGGIHHGKEHPRRSWWVCVTHGQQWPCRSGEAS